MLAIKTLTTNKSLNMKSSVVSIRHRIVRVFSHITVLALLRDVINKYCSYSARNLH